MDAALEDLLAGTAVRAAPRLIGWRLRVAGREAIIAETEAYQGVTDRACHASRGRTPRSELLFAPHGALYVYLCYGMHWLLNLVCDRPGIPAAVLLRGLRIEGLDPRRSNGPGKLTRELGIDGRWHGRQLDDCPIELLPPLLPVGPLRRGPRVGVAFAGSPWAERPWRWWQAGFPAVGSSTRGE